MRSRVIRRLTAQPPRHMIDVLKSAMSSKDMAFCGRELTTTDLFAMSSGTAEVTCGACLSGYNQSLAETIERDEAEMRDAVLRLYASGGDVSVQEIPDIPIDQMLELVNQRRVALGHLPLRNIETLASITDTCEEAMALCPDRLSEPERPLPDAILPEEREEHETEPAPSSPYPMRRGQPDERAIQALSSHEKEIVLQQLIAGISPASIVRALRDSAASTAKILAAAAQIAGSTVMPDLDAGEVVEGYDENATYQRGVVVGGGQYCRIWGLWASSPTNVIWATVRKINVQPCPLDKKKRPTLAGMTRVRQDLNSVDARYRPTPVTDED